MNYSGAIQLEPYHVDACYGKAAGCEELEGFREAVDST